MTVIQHGGRRNIGNYRVFEDGGFVVVEYRGTDVATFDLGPKRRVRLNTGTYYTATTKNVMNAALRAYRHLTRYSKRLLVVYRRRRARAG